MTRPTMTAALRRARTEVTTLRRENGGYVYSACDHDYQAWIVSRPTWYSAAQESRRMALGRAAIHWACTEFGLADGGATAAIERGVWSGATLRRIVAARIGNLIAA